MSSDPVQQAAQAAKKLVDSKIEYVKTLAAAQATEQPLQDLVTAAKDAHRHASGTAAEQHTATALQAAQDGLKAAQQYTSEQRQAAYDAGWTRDELIELNLAQPRRARSQSRSRTQSTQHDQPNTAAPAEAHTGAESAPATSTSSAETNTTVGSTGGP